MGNGSSDWFGPGIGIGISLYLGKKINIDNRYRRRGYAVVSRQEKGRECGKGRLLRGGHGRVNQLVAGGGSRATENEGKQIHTKKQPWTRDRGHLRPVDWWTWVDRERRPLDPMDSICVAASGGEDPEREKKKRASARSVCFKRWRR